MNMITKNNIYEEHLKSWLRAKRDKDKKKRGEIIRHICFVVGVHPKSVSRSFERIQMRVNSGERRGRKEFYTPDVTFALKEVWNIASEPCAENLHGVIADYVRILTRDGVWQHPPEVTRKLLVMSLGTMKKRVGKFIRKCFVAHGKSTTSAGTIHSLIPVRSGDWAEAVVGTEQIDTVAHCGNTLISDFVYTVNSTDVTTLWGARRAQWNKGKIKTVENMDYIQQDLPFSVLEWHPDSGSEFINWHCKEWCEQQKQKLTRSRPYKKNDNCFVEERNGHIVRRWLGYSRFNQQKLVEAINLVYDVLTLYTNHFVASRRIVYRERMGAKWKVIRENLSKTPYQRVLEKTGLHDKIKEQLTKNHEKLNPLILKEEIEKRLKEVFKIVNSPQ